MARDYDREMRDAERAMGGGFFAAKKRREELEHNAGRDYVPAPGEEIGWEINALENMDPACVDMTYPDGSVRIAYGGRGCNASYLHLRPLAVIRDMAALIGHDGCSNREWADRCGTYPANISAGERAAIVSAEADGNYAENAAVVVERINAERAMRLSQLREAHADATEKGA